MTHCAATFSFITLGQKAGIRRADASMTVVRSFGNRAPTWAPSPTRYPETQGLTYGPRVAIAICDLGFGLLGVATVIDGRFTTTKVASRAALVSVGGKLRGSRARQLGDQLADLSDAGNARVVLDMRQLVSIDSLGTYALEEAINNGLRLHLVVRPGFEFDGFFASRSLQRRGLKLHRKLDEALACVRQIQNSGFSLV